jgi:hypothetical protein
MLCLCTVPLLNHAYVHAAAAAASHMYTCTQHSAVHGYGAQLDAWLLLRANSAAHRLLALPVQVERDLWWLLLAAETFARRQL